MQDAEVDDGATTDWENVYRKEAPRLWRALVLQTGDAEIASDAVAEAFAQAIARGTAITKPGAWVWKAAFMIARASAGEQRSEPPPELASNQLALEPVIDLIKELGTLSGMQRGAIVLHYFAGYSVAKQPRSSARRDRRSACTSFGQGTSSGLDSRAPMNDLRDHLRQANRLEVPDLWAEVETRARSGVGRVPALRPPGPRRQRFAAAVVAGAIFVVAGTFAWTALRPGSEKHNEGTFAATPPGWLLDQARRMARLSGDPRPTSAQWVLTDAETAAPAVGLTPDQATEAPEYLVVLQGNFTVHGKLPAGQEEPTGHTLAFTVDPDDRQVLDIGVSNQEITVPGLMSFELGPAEETDTTERLAYLTPFFIFTGTDGWHVKDNGWVAKGEAAIAWASTIAFNPDDLIESAPAIPPKTIAELPEDGIIVTAEVTPWSYDPSAGPYPPDGLEPFDLASVTPRGPEAEEPEGNYSVLEIDNGYVLVRVYLGKAFPSEALVRRAQSELDTLQVPPVCPVHTEGGFGAMLSTESGTPGSTVAIQGLMPFQHEDGSYDTAGKTTMVAWWNAVSDDEPYLLPFSTVQPSPVGPGEIVRLGDGGTGACSFTITFTVPDVPSGDYPIVVIEEVPDGGTLWASLTFHVT